MDVEIEHGWSILDAVEEDDEVPAIIVLGLPGVGKSTFLNEVFEPLDAFTTGSGGASHTRAIKVTRCNFNMKSVDIIDTVGAFDTEDHFQDWCENILKSISNHNIHQVLYIVNASAGVSIEDKLLSVVVKWFVDTFGLACRLDIVFSHCESQLGYLMQATRGKWLQDMNCTCNFSSGFDINRTLPWCAEAALSLEDDGSRKVVAVFEAAKNNGFNPEMEPVPMEITAALAHDGLRAVVIKQIQATLNRSALMRPPLAAKRLKLSQNDLQQLRAHMRRAVGASVIQQYEDRLFKRCFQCGLL